MRWIPGTLALLLTAAVAHAGDLVPTNPRFGPLRVTSHRVEVTIDNQIAMTRVEQVFANDHGTQLEAHYVFPVPKGATIVDFSMTVNGKLMRGELLEKQRARRIYESIVRRSKDPGLLEHVGANVFRVRVFPILARSQQKIELTYVERLSYDQGRCRYIYPLRTPGGKGRTTADRFDLKWRVSSRVPIKHVSSPTHRVNVARRTDSEAEVTWTGRDVDLSRDIEIEYRIGRTTVGMDLVAHRPKGEEGTFMLLITPPVAPDVKPLPKDMTFVFDTSGSMEGKRIEQARAALRFCLSKLRADDRFNIVSFAGDVRTFKDAHVPASDENKTRAVRFINSLDATGGTNIHLALRTALRHRAEASRPHLIVFLTDGEPTVGIVNPKSIVRDVLARNRANVRIFAFGVGNSLNRVLLDHLADATNAVSQYVEEQENIEVKVSRLQKKIASPLITGLSLDWGDAEVTAVYPRSPGDLYLGTQLILTGRYRKAGSFEVALQGRTGSSAFALRRTLEFPERRDESAAVPYLWAMRKIASILDEIDRTGENSESVRQLIGLSRKYRIATPYTSFLVLDTEQAYDQRGIDRRGASYKPPMRTAKAPVGPARRNTGKVYVPRIRPALYPSKKVLMKKAVEDPVYRKNAEASDHNETSDEEEFAKAKGDSLDFVSDKPYKGRGTYDVISGGGGGGGRYGARLGGKRNLVARGGGGADTEDAVLRALRWLAKNQKPDGSWEASRKQFTPGVTGLSLLAFLGAGYSHLSKDTYDGICFGDTVRKGLQWMMSHQDREGCIGFRNAEKYIYSHAICALALSEAYGLTGSNLFKDQAQKAIDFLIAAQNPGKGWRYSHRCADNDTSVTAWATMALKSAEISGLAFPRTGYDGIRAWLDEVTEGNGRVGYTMKGTGKVFIPGSNEKFEHHETLTAIGVMARIFIDKNKADPRLSAGCDLLLRDLPRREGNAVDFYYWYFGSLALFQYDGPSGPKWRTWNANMKKALVETQRVAGDGKGSWAPVGRWCGKGGRVYATAINALTLEVYYRYANVFGTK